MSIIKRSPWVSFFNAGGCIPGDTMMIVGDGDILTAKEIIEDKLEGKDFSRLAKDEVLARACETRTISWNGTSPKEGKITTAYKLPSDGKLVEIRTATTMLRLTPEHKVLVDSVDGPVWKNAGELSKNDYLYSPRELKVREERVPHLLEWLPASFLVHLDSTVKERMREKLKMRFGNLKKAADRCGISYKRLTHRTEGLSGEEIRSISEETGIGLRQISKQVRRVVKGTCSSRVRAKDADKELMYSLGLIASDGSISGHMEGGRKSYRIRFDNNERKLVTEFMKNCKRWAPGAKISYWKEGDLHRVWVYHYPLAFFASYVGLKGLGRKSHDLRRIFKMPQELIASFIAGFFDGDGTAVIQKSNGKARKSIEIAVKEYKTAKMLQMLLKRMGIISKILASINKSTFGTRTMHSVRITTNQDIARFIKKIPVKHPKKKKKICIMKCLLEKDPTNKGRIYNAPLACGKIIREIRRKHRLKGHEMFNPTFLSMIENGKRVEKSSIMRVCKELEGKTGKTEDTKRLRKLLSEEGYLDPVKSIKNVKNKEGFVYNFNVAETHKYVPEGAFVVSNCNGCTLEVFACFSPRYDVTRFGIELKASAKHADVLLVTGIVNKHNVKRLLMIYEHLPEPKRVVAIGACAVSGGLYNGSYSQAGPVDKIIPVDVYVPGCPPRPESIIDGIRKCLNDKRSR